MKGYEWIGWLCTTFLGFTIINRILGGGLISAADVAILSQMKITQNVNVGFISIPIPGLNYVQAIIQMATSNYDTLFTGNAQLIYFFFQTVTFMIGFAIVALIISIGVNAIRGR